jgi:hypothetical protein
MMHGQKNIKLYIIQSAGQEEGKLLLYSQCPLTTADFYPVTNFPAFCVTQRFITLSSTASHQSLPWIKTLPPHFRRILLLAVINGQAVKPASSLKVILPKPFTCLYAMRSTRPANLILHSLFTVTKYIRHFVHPAVTFSLSGPNTVLGILFSNTLCLCSSFTETDQLPHL